MFNGLEIINMGKSTKTTDKNRLSILNPILCLEWYVFNTFSPNEVSWNSSKTALWVCLINKNHKWFARIADRNKGSGCPFCSGNKVCIDNCLLTKNPKLCLEWDYENEKRLRPEMFTENSNKIVDWRCLLKGHKFKATINSRSNGSECSICCGKKACKENCLATLNPELAQEWDYENNNELTPFDVTCFSMKNIGWDCKICRHKWKASLANRNNGSGCPNCQFRVDENNCFAAINPELAKEFDLEVNFPLTPFSVSFGTDKKVGWTCPRNHKYKAKIGQRNHGTGCPHCKQSKGNNKVKEILEKYNTRYDPEYSIEECRSIRKLPFDFGVLNENTQLLSLIEYQGEQHYRPIKKWGGDEELIEIQKRDLIKFNYCKENNIPLLRIHYKDFKNIEKLIKEFLNIE